MILSGASHTPSPAAPKKDWTVLYCMDGNNDLEPYEAQNVLDLETVGSSKDVNVVVQFSRGDHKTVYGKHSHEKTGLDGDWVGSRRYLIEKNPHAAGKNFHSPAVEKTDVAPDHGDPSTLADFISWGMQKYPAKHYMVVVGDHGEGFRGTGFDFAHHDHLDLPGLKQALQTVQDTTGKKPDVLTFDTCLMASSEVAYQLKDQARYLVGSEELVGAEGLPNVALLKSLEKTPDLSGRELACKLVDLSRDDAIARAKDGRDEAATQMSAIDLSKAGALGDAFKTLGGRLQESHLHTDTLSSIIHQTKHFDEQDYERPLNDFRDVTDFCDNLKSNPHVNDDVKAAATKLQQAVDTAVIDSHHEGAQTGKAQGLSVYLPHQDNFKHWHYDQTDFDQHTGWSSALQQKLG